MKLVRESNILELNKEQLLASFNASGEPLPLLSVNTEKVNETGRVDLKDKGDFQRGFILKESGGKVSITSTDKKTDLLKTKYGDNIFGLTEDNQTKLIEGLSSDIEKEIKEEISKISDQINSAFF